MLASAEVGTYSKASSLQIEGGVNELVKVGCDWTDIGRAAEYAPNPQELFPWTDKSPEVAEAENAIEIVLVIVEIVLPF